MLLFLTRRDAQQSLGYSFRVGKATVPKIITETCSAIYETLNDNSTEYLILSINALSTFAVREKNYSSTNAFIS